MGHLLKAEQPSQLSASSSACGAFASQKGACPLSKAQAEYEHMELQHLCGFCSHKKGIPNFAAK